MRSAAFPFRVAGLQLSVCLLLSLSAAMPLAAAAGHWSALGPEGGSPRVLAFAPADPRRVYAGLDGGGVFLSTDGGRSWTAPRGGIAGQSVSAIAVDPENPAVAFAGTTNGVWKTATGGEAWQAFPDHLAGRSVLDLAIDPSRRQTVYAATTSGVFRSDDGGRHWTAASQGLPKSGQVARLALGAPDRLFVAFQLYTEVAELFVSNDRGVSWNLIEGGGLAPIDEVSGFVWDRTSHTLYLAAIPAPLQTGTRSLWKSSDGGATWSQSAIPEPLAGNSVPLAVDSTGALYAGGLGVWKSPDGGAHWTEVGGIPDNGGLRVFGFATSLAADPGRPGRLLAGTFDLGIFESTGGPWRAVNHGLTATMSLGLGVASSPRQPYLYVAVLGQGVFRSRDGGAHWRPRNQGLELEDAFYPDTILSSLVLDPKHPARLYAGVIGGIARSTDGGGHWDFRSIDKCNVPAILAVDSDARTIYAQGDGDSRTCTLHCFVYVSRDDGDTWACLPGIFQAQVALVDPLSSAVVYMGADYAGLFKSTDHGLHFVHADRGLDAQYVYGLAISPAAHQVVYAATDKGVFRSVDGGAHWAALGGGLPATVVTALAVDPADARIIYVGLAELGLFRSVDGGTTWTPLNDGLPVPAFAGLVLDPRDPRTLYAGTFGSGFWTITLPK